MAHQRSWTLDAPTPTVCDALLALAAYGAPSPDDEHILSDACVCVVFGALKRVFQQRNVSFFLQMRFVHRFRFDMVRPLFCGRSDDCWKQCGRCQGWQPMSVVEQSFSVSFATNTGSNPLQHTFNKTIQLFLSPDRSALYRDRSPSTRRAWAKLLILCACAIALWCALARVQEPGARDRAKTFGVSAHEILTVTLPARVQQRMVELFSRNKSLQDRRASICVGIDLFFEQVQETRDSSCRKDPEESASIQGEKPV